MSECCNGNNTEILSVIFGYTEDASFLKKSLWWITRDLKNTEAEAIIIDDGSCGNVKHELEKYEVRIKSKIIKINNSKLLEFYNIDSLQKSVKLSYAICEKFASNKKVFISPRTIAYNYCFKDFVNFMQNDKVITMRTYKIPIHVQVGICEHSSNFNDFLSFECKKYPLYNEYYPAKKLDHITKAYCGSEIDKESIFLDYESYYIYSDEHEKEHLDNINYDLIEKIVENNDNL